MVVTNCSNNYRAYRFPEKLIPLTIPNAWQVNRCRYMATGTIRDWLYVEDHAVRCHKWRPKARAARPTTSAVITSVKYRCGAHHLRHSRQGGGAEAGDICQFADLITFVTDRPGHDLRYAIDARNSAQSGPGAAGTFESGSKTVHWYLNNQPWWQRVLDGSYAGERLGPNN